MLFHNLILESSCVAGLATKTRANRLGIVSPLANHASYRAPFYAHSKHYLIAQSDRARAFTCFPITSPSSTGSGLGVCCVLPLVGVYNCVQCYWCSSQCYNVTMSKIRLEDVSAWSLTQLVPVLQPLFHTIPHPPNASAFCFLCFPPVPQPVPHSTAFWCLQTPSDGPDLSFR